jgi:hypothetical protein
MGRMEWLCTASIVVLGERVRGSNVAASMRECGRGVLVTRLFHKRTHIAQLRMRMVASVVYWLSVSYLFVMVVTHSSIPICALFLLTRVCPLY